MYEYTIRGSENKEGKVRKIGKAIAVIVDKSWMGEKVTVIREAELQGMIKEGAEQSWRKFILERAAIDSSNEIHSKGINADALRGLCLEYDVENGAFHGGYEGFGILEFFLETVLKVQPTYNEEEWNKRVMELHAIKEKEKEGKGDDGIMCAYTAAIYTEQLIHAEQPWYISIHPITLNDDVEYAKALMRKGLDNITQEDLRGNMSVVGYDAERKKTIEILCSLHPKIKWRAWGEAIKAKEGKE